MAVSATVSPTSAPFLRNETSMFPISFELPKSMTSSTHEVRETASKRIVSIYFFMSLRIYQFLPFALLARLSAVDAHQRSVVMLLVPPSQPATAFAYCSAL